MLVPVVLDATFWSGGQLIPESKECLKPAYATGSDHLRLLAFHPGTGELYVSEEEPGRISVIRDGKPVVGNNGLPEVINTYRMGIYSRTRF